MLSKFIRTKEDFTCAHCGYRVLGNGYTNHCLKCLWSKHVDINPGDRAESCGGLMEPVGLEQKGQEYKIIHRCATCGIEKKVKINKEDDWIEIIKLSNKW